MTDILMELLRAVVVGGIILVLFKTWQSKAISRISGWRTLVAGFGLIFFGTVIDITDNFEELNRFIIIGDTEVQAFLEKVVGYLLGFVLLALGIFRWLPRLIEHEELIQIKIEVQEERLKVFSATMRTVHDIVNNFLNNLQLFRLEAEEKNALEPESLELMESIIQDTTSRLKKLGDLDSISVTQMAHGARINYEENSPQESAQQVNPPKAKK
jgi:hypothetical protein